MKTPLETARRWLAQTEYNLNRTRSLLENGFWAGACFQAEQTSQLALKAFLYFKGKRYVTFHSVQALATECAQEDPDFSRFEVYGSSLDRYYLATRYPDVLREPAVPFQSFHAEEARQATDQAAEIVELVKTHVSGSRDG